MKKEGPRDVVNDQIEKRATGISIAPRSLCSELPLFHGEYLIVITLTDDLFDIWPKKDSLWIVSV